MKTVFSYTANDVDPQHQLDIIVNDYNASLTKSLKESLSRTGKGGLLDKTKFPTFSYK